MADLSDRHCRTAIILAAGSATSLGAGVHGRTSAAMVPVSGQPVVHRTLSYLHEIGIKRVIMGARAEDLRLHQFVTTRWSGRFDLTWVTPDANRGPGYTLLCCLQETRAGEACIVVLGDTAFRLRDTAVLDSDTSTVLTSVVAETERWCLATVDGAGRVTALADKPATAPTPYIALIGAYILSDVAVARTALEVARSASNRRIEISVALEPFIASQRLIAEPVGEWIDAGNPDKLAEARRHLIAPREFNHLALDSFRGTITKRSRNTEKFVAEIDYYRNLPDRLRVFFPRLLSASSDADQAFMELEYYGYPTLSELWTFEDLSEAFWRNVVVKLGCLLDELAANPHPLDATRVVAFYRDKTLSRMHLASTQSALADVLVAPELRVNDVRVPGWGAIMRELPDRLETLRAGVAGRVIHGDLCFPNILFDATLGLFRLIDPRGSFVEQGVHGDGRLDAAKLMHSTQGGYDLLINDLFALRGERGEYQMQLSDPAHRAVTQTAMQRMLGDRFDLKELRLIEATLFLSMAALHADRPARQRAMMIIGVLLYHDALDDANLYRR